MSKPQCDRMAFLVLNVLLLLAALLAAEESPQPVSVAAIQDHGELRAPEIDLEEVSPSRR